MAPIPKKRSRKNTHLQEAAAPQSEAAVTVEESLPALSPIPPATLDVDANMDDSPDVQVTTLDDPQPPPISEPLTETKFENIFYNPQTHVSAVVMLKDQLQSMTKSISRVRARSGEEKNLRSSDPKTEKQGQSKTGNTAAAAQSSKTGQPRASTEGMAMVRELLNRYETNKRKAKYGSQEVKEKCKVEPEDDDDFEFDENELDLWDDDEDDLEVKSDFLKYTVPQYDVKQKLCDMHFSTIKKMTPGEVEKSCITLIPELKEILNETVFCKRHDIFKKSGISKQALREISVAEPFNSAQDYRVVTVINNVLFSDKQPEDFSAELLQYVSHVLVPEALIRIYATANKISIELAEKELRFGAGYDGKVDDELVKTLTGGLVKSEVV